MADCLHSICESVAIIISSCSHHRSKAKNIAMSSALMMVYTCTCELISPTCTTWSLYAPHFHLSNHTRLSKLGEPRLLSLAPICVYLDVGPPGSYFFVSNLTLNLSPMSAAPHVFKALPPIQCPLHLLCFCKVLGLVHATHDVTTCAYIGHN